MKQYLQAAVLSIAALGILPHSMAVAEQSATQPTVVELFTSQSCYSCPPAEKILSELAQRDDIIALEHHVDYWDRLVHGADGQWKDIFPARNQPTGSAATIVSFQAPGILTRRK